MFRIMGAVLLIGSSAVATVPPKAEPQKVAARDDDKPVCKTWAPTGSLIANHKECRTKHDWDQMRIDTSHIVQGGSCNSAESGQCY